MRDFLYAEILYFILGGVFGCVAASLLLILLDYWGIL